MTTTESAPNTDRRAAHLRYRIETADEIFPQLADALNLQPDYQRLYAAWAQTFHRILDQQTAAVDGRFVGAYAKTDYLLKEHSADGMMRRNINATRVRLQKYEAAKPSELQEFVYSDFKHLCLFVELVFGQAVPADLVCHFPLEQARGYASVLDDSMRAIVVSWDDHCILCRIDGYNEDEPTLVLYDPTSEELATADDRITQDFRAPDYSYLRKMLREGAQLNIIRPRKVGDHLCAELIIFEPDYLVDISTIARCFESYAESPYVNLVKKLEKSRSSEPILMGNFAGQLLDEELHTLSEDHTYNDSVSDFFKTSAIPLLTTELSPNFHRDAKVQQEHIRQAIGVQLPKMVSRFRRDECIVEPSFFCEMLGLQGRMDMLQLDFRVLLEQKAGKGQYPQGDFSLPRHTEQHYVQLLLYMAILRYNFRDEYEANNRELHAFLLYSKYQESLLGLGFAPELLQRAIKIRNGIACTELQFSTPGELRIIERLTPEMLNMKKAKGTLWDRYTRPQLEGLLAPVHEASDLERDYYFRFLTFIAGEHVLAKLGNKTKEASGFAAKWHNTLEEKLEAGNIFVRMHFDGDVRKGDSGVTGGPTTNDATTVAMVRFAFDEGENYESLNFRIGDIVALYPYDATSAPDIRRAIVFRGSTAEITPSHLIVQLRAPQTSTRVFEHWQESVWAIEHDFMESSYGAMYRSMHAFLSAPKSRRDLLLLQREPNVAEIDRALSKDYGAFNELSGRVKNADELFLIIGPPGTGKTSFGMLNTLVEALSDPEASVLLLSFTNRAVDEICSKLVEEGIDFLRIGRSYNTPEAYRPYLLEQQILSCRNLQSLRHLIAGKRVVVATTTTLNSQIALLQLKQFSLAIIDEASQILEPDLIGIVSAHNDGVPAIGKFVLIGDHKQLPAVVQQTSAESAVTEPSLRAIGLNDCRSSLFERLLSRYANDPRVTFMLTRQGRMHPAIADFVNEEFYNGRLGIVPLPHQTEQLPIQRICFIDAPLPTNVVAGQRMKVNHVEAEMIAKTVFDIYEQNAETFDPLATIGVIVPYRNQITAIRNAIDHYGVPMLRNITIDTVERYQGSQRDYIIYGFTVQRPYQLNFLTDNVFIDSDGTVIDRKLNVALTRAKRAMLLFGHAPLLRQVPTFKRLIDFIAARGALISSQTNNLQVDPPITQ